MSDLIHVDSTLVNCEVAVIVFEQGEDIFVCGAPVQRTITQERREQGHPLSSRKTRCEMCVGKKRTCDRVLVKKGWQLTKIYRNNVKRHFSKLCFVQIWFHILIMWYILMSNRKSWEFSHCLKNGKAAFIVTVNWQMVSVFHCLLVSVKTDLWTALKLCNVFVSSAKFLQVRSRPKMEWLQRGCQSSRSPRPHVHPIFCSSGISGTLSGNFSKIWHRHPLGLRDELIGFVGQRSKSLWPAERILSRWP